MFFASKPCSISHTTFTVNATSWTTSQVVKNKKYFGKRDSSSWNCHKLFEMYWYVCDTAHFVFTLQTAFATENYIGVDRLFSERENLLEKKKSENKAWAQTKKSVRLRGCLSGFILSGVSSFQPCLIPFIRTWKASRFLDQHFSEKAVTLKTMFFNVEKGRSNIP